MINYNQKLTSWSSSEGKARNSTPAAANNSRTYLNHKQSVTNTDLEEVKRNNESEKKEKKKKEREKENSSLFLEIFSNQFWDFKMAGVKRREDSKWYLTSEWFLVLDILLA